MYCLLFTQAYWTKKSRSLKSPSLRDVAPRHWIIGAWRIKAS